VTLALFPFFGTADNQPQSMKQENEQRTQGWETEVNWQEKQRIRAKGLLSGSSVDAWTSLDRIVPSE